MTSHLTMEELVDGTRAHAGCQQCDAEAAAWSAVRAGVRHRAGGAPPAAEVLPSVLERRDRKRRYLLPLSAAAAVALAAGGYGAAAALGHGANATRTSTQGSHPGTRQGGTAAQLTATGCTGLELAGGTLTRISGNDLVLATAGSAQATVTTTRATAIYRETAGTLGDVTDGKRVLVTGSLAGGTLAAASVGVLPDTLTAPARPDAFAGLGIGLATGTVANTRDGGFTLVEEDGTRIAVTTTAAVTVITTTRVGVAQLATGAVTSAVGTAGADGTLAASTVEQDAVPAATWQKLRPHPPAGLPGGVPSGLPGSLPAGGLPSGAPAISTPRISLNGLGCSPAAITTSYLLASHLQQ